MAIFMEKESEFPCGANLEDLQASIACRDGLRVAHCPICKKMQLIPLEQSDENCEECRDKKDKD